VLGNSRFQIRIQAHPTETHNPPKIKDRTVLHREQEQLPPCFFFLILTILLFFLFFYFFYIKKNCAFAVLYHHQSHFCLYIELYMSLLPVTSPHFFRFSRIESRGTESRFSRLFQANSHTTHNDEHHVFSTLSTET